MNRNIIGLLMFAGALGGGCVDLNGAGDPQRHFYGPLVQAENAPPPISGGTLLALADGKTAVVADPERDQVTVVDLAASPAGKVRGVVKLEPGDEPGRLAEDGAGRVFVALRRGGAVVTIDVASARSVARQVVCPSPRGLAWRKATHELLVACVNGQIHRLQDNAAPVVTYVAPDLRDVVVTDRDTIYATRFRSAEVLGLDASLAVQFKVVPPEYQNPRQRSGQPFAASVAWRAAAIPGRDAIVVAHQRAQTTQIAPIVSPGYYVQQTSVPQDPIAHSTVTIVESGLVTGGPAFDGHVLPVDVAVSADGKRMVVPGAGNAAPAEGGLRTLTPAAVVSLTPTTIDVAAYPGALDGQVVAAAITPAGDTLFQTREPAKLRSSKGIDVTLATDSRADSGHLIFHTAPSASSQMACATCHPEGGEDGHTWYFAEGQRRSIDVRGGIARRAPYHWDGNERDFAALCSDVFSKRMGGPTIESDEQGALAGWLDRVPALPPQGTKPNDQVQRGAWVYDSLQCGECHAEGASKRFSIVGTGMQVKAPLLRSVAWRTPLFHNGCASTLADRFDRQKASCNGGSSHAKTDNLSQGDVDALVAYLESL